MLMPRRSFSSASAYKFGFNGKENDNEVKGLGNQQDYGMRIYDARVGRFLSRDPLQKNYPYYSPYQYAGNQPSWATDLDGMEPYYKSGVKNIPSKLDTEVYDGQIDDYKGIIAAKAIEYENKTYVVFESVHGNRQWYQEFDKNGFKGSPTEFEWYNPGNDKSFHFLMAGAVVAVPGILYAKAIGVYLLSEVVEELAGVPVPDGPVDLWKHYMKQKAKRELAEKAIKKTANELDWKAVVPKKGRYKGETRDVHVRRHNKDDVSKDYHGIFNGDGVDMTNKAWKKAQELGLKPDKDGSLVVPFNNAGREGGKLGKGEKLDKIQIYVVPGTNQIITAFPIK